MENGLGTLRTADEWINFLVDRESFLPFLTQSSSELTTGFGDEVMTGFAQVSGKPVAIWATRPEIHQGYITSQGAIKIRRLMDRALDLGTPIVSLLSSAGVSIEEGVKSGEEYSRVLMGSAELSGQIPQIACVMGVNIGAPAYSAAVQDFVLGNRTRSYLCVSGPGVVKQMLGENSTFSQLGGASLHFQDTGLMHFVDANPEAQLRRCQWLLSFLPSNCLEEAQPVPPREPQFELPATPLDPKVALDMKAWILGLVDRSEFIEYSSGFGGSALCGYASIGGFPVAIVANQSLVMSGAIGCDAARKMARFIRLSDAYNIPILTLIDAPGFMPGVHEEKNGILQAGAELIYAMKTRTPKLSVVVRKCYGAAAIVLCATRSWRGDLVLALPTAQNAVMGFDAAKDVMYKGDSRPHEELRRDYFETQEHPRNSMRLGLVDEIVQPQDLRKRLGQHLKLLFGKRPQPDPAVREVGP